MPRHTSIRGKQKRNKCSKEGLEKTRYFQKILARLHEV